MPSVMLRLDIEVGEKGLDEYEIAIGKYCGLFCERLIAKYRKGKAEHGDNPQNINIQQEIHDEVLDILNYHIIDRVNQQKAKVDNG